MAGAALRAASARVTWSRGWAATSSPSCCPAPTWTAPSSSPSGSGARPPSSCRRASAGEISLSLGVAAAGGDQAFPLELMSRADEQLYRAKITRNAVGAPRRDPAADRRAPLPTRSALAQHLEGLRRPGAAGSRGPSRPRWRGRAAADGCRTAARTPPAPRRPPPARRPGPPGRRPRGARCPARRRPRPRRPAATPAAGPVLRAQR